MTSTALAARSGQSPVRQRIQMLRAPVRIVVQEWRLIRGNATAILALAAFGSAVVYALWTGSSFVRQQHLAAQRVEAENEARLADLRGRAEVLERQAAMTPAESVSVPAFGPRHPVYAIGWARPHAVLPPAPLAFLAVGESDLVPHAFEVRTNVPMEAFAATERTEHPLAALTGHLDFEFVVVFLYPLAIVGLMFNAVSEEREHGTLRLLLSQPVSLRAVVGAKLLARAACLHVVFIAAVILGVAMAETGGATGGRAAGSVAVTATVGLYGTFWLAVTALVAGRAQTSGCAALLLVAIWLAVVIVQPAAASFMAEAMFPAPSRVELVNARRAADAVVATATTSLEAKLFEAYPEYADLTVKTVLGREYVGNAAEAVEMDRQMADIRQRAASQRNRRSRLLSWARVAAPAMLVRDGVRALAGTDAARYEDFLRQLGEYHAEWRRYFWPRTFVLSPMSTAEYDGVPRFRFRERGQVDVIGSALLAATPLAVMTAAMMIGAIALLRRAEPQPDRG
jgi:ABC-2 type transport system permease protein